MAPFVIRACPGSTWATPGADRRRDKNEIFFDRLQMIQFAKLRGLNQYLDTFRKFCLLQGDHNPVLEIFREKYENMTIKNLAGRVRYTVIL